MQFENQDERWIAKHEGWTIRAGCVARYFNSRGECPFSSMMEIFEFFAVKGRTSELHKRLYLEMPWTAVDQELAHARNFQLHAGSKIIPRNGSSVSEIENALKRDAEAGDPFAMKVLLTIATNKLLR